VTPDLTSDLPTALTKQTRWARLGPSEVPVMLVQPRPDPGGGNGRAPALLWMHGRTVSKETDPGRYLRLMRAGIGVCAIDLPGHGERFDAALQAPGRTLDLIMQMIDEIDAIVDALPAETGFDVDRLAIGGMSAGGMAALARLCRDHPFVCTAVEAATGSWEHQRHRAMFEGRTDACIARDSPIENLDAWREIPVQAIHSRRDTWVSFDGQEAFLDALRRRYADPDVIDLVLYEETGAPFEHAGFGRMAADAKNRQRDFLGRWLVGV
jgi:dipeptidyl aminopeptidase/acylaminoacyl peptidase